MTTVLTVCVQIVLAAASGTQGSVAWTNQDIGEVTIRGSATYNERAMVWIVRGGGSDIFGQADSFHYVCQRLRGDGSIIAKVESLDRTDPWGKGGVMIRESLDAGSRFVAVFATPDYGVRCQARAATNGAAASSVGGQAERPTDLKAPVWVKLERKGNQFSGYYATEKTDPVWVRMTDKPQAVTMSETVHVGLALTSHAQGVLCEARFGSVAVSGVEGGIVDAEILADPKQTLRKAYRDLERLGNWRADRKTIKEHGNLIASSLIAIARVKELNGASASAVLPDYYRVAELVLDSPYTVDALIRIAILDGQKGLEYAVKRLATGSMEDRDRLYVAVMKGYSNRAETPGREVAVKSFVEYVGKNSRFTLIEQVIADLGDAEQAAAVCRSLIQHCMAQPSSVQIAVVGLRYMALQAGKGQGDIPIQEVSQWAATQFKDTRLAACAKAILADTYYERRLYVKAVEAFQPGLFSGNRPESKTVEDIEGVLASYRANTLLQSIIDPARIYQALGEKAGRLGRNVVALHCQRKIAEAKGLFLDDFKQSALKGVKYCDSSPENEVWFWKGLIAAEDEDLGTAAAAYERFVAEDDKSVLAARAYYDIARAKMATGEDAKEWIAKAKALSPCNAVIQFERRSIATVSPQR